MGPMETEAPLLLDEDAQDVDRGFQIGSHTSYAYGLSFYAAIEKIWGGLAGYGDEGHCEDHWIPSPQ
jgi:hypothetical protein